MSVRSSRHAAVQYFSLRGGGPIGDSSMCRRLTNILAATALTSTLAGGIATSAQAMPLPVASAARIAGAVPIDQVRWWGWRGGWGWGRGWGGALAAGAVV